MLITNVTWHWWCADIGRNSTNLFNGGEVPAMRSQTQKQHQQSHESSPASQNSSASPPKAQEGVEVAGESLVCWALRRIPHAAPLEHPVPHGKALVLVGDSGFRPVWRRVRVYIPWRVIGVGDQRQSRPLSGVSGVHSGSQLGPRRL